MQLATTDVISGVEIEETLGVVTGATVRTRAIGHDLVAGLKSIVGGEIGSYQNLLSESRRQAMQRMEAEAQMLGADAVVGMRFGTSDIAEGAAEVLAYGTAVRLQLADRPAPADRTDSVETSGLRGSLQRILVDTWVHRRPDSSAHSYAARLRAGSIVTVLAEADGFLRIEAEGGVRGFIDPASASGANETAT